MSAAGEPGAESPRLRPDLVLVGCVKTKRAVRSPAKDLYDSPLWRRRRGYAEGLGSPWFILSALHGLLDPDRRICPYELALTDLRVAARRAWSDRVLAALSLRFPSLRGKLVEIHAGAAYADHGLEAGLRAAGATVRRPLARITGIGRQQAWYRRHAPGAVADPAPDVPRPPGNPDVARIAEQVSEDFYRAHLDLASRGMPPGQPWPDMPEVRAVRRLRSLAAIRGQAAPLRTRAARHVPPGDPADRSVRLFLTFVAAMDRARDATQLWNAGADLFENSPEFFDPRQVAELDPEVVRTALKRARVSRRHGPDSAAWHRIAKSLANGSESPVRRVIDAGGGDARELLRDLASRSAGGARFPLLRGPKLGPMWVRMMADPGGARIEGIETVPVAVDVQVRRATENLGATRTCGLPLPKAKPEIQRAWTDAAATADIAGPVGIKGTCAALDPALWFFGRHGCGHCEKLGARVPFGRACDSCVRFR